MRFHRRGALPERVTAVLGEWQRELDATLAAESSRPTSERRTGGAIADEHWTSHRQTKAFEVVVEVLSAMASPDLARCMYCEHDRGSQIDHAEPKSLAPTRTFEWLNHVWACGKCNGQKLERYHRDMVIPTIDDPLKHLGLVPSGRWTASDGDARGQATLDTLPLLNHEKLIGARQRCLLRLLRELGALAARASPSSEEIESFREMATNEPFSDVFAALMAQAALPGAAAFYSPVVLQFVAAHPEMHRWLPDADERRLRDAEPKVLELTKAMRSRAKQT